MLPMTFPSFHLISKVILKIKPNLRLCLFDCQIFLRGTKIIFISRCEQKINFNLLHKSKTNKSDLLQIYTFLFVSKFVKIISLFSGFEKTWNRTTYQRGLFLSAAIVHSPKSKLLSRFVKPQFLSCVLTVDLWKNET